MFTLLLRELHYMVRRNSIGGGNISSLFICQGLFKHAINASPGLVLLPLVDGEGLVACLGKPLVLQIMKLNCDYKNRNEIKLKVVYGLKKN